MFYVFGVVSFSGGDYDDTPTNQTNQSNRPPRHTNATTTNRPETRAAQQSSHSQQQRPKRARRVIQQFSIVCVCVGSGRVSKIVRSFGRLVVYLPRSPTPRLSPAKVCSVSPLLLSRVCLVLLLLLCCYCRFLLWSSCGTPHNPTAQLIYIHTND